MRRAAAIALALALALPQATAAQVVRTEAGEVGGMTLPSGVEAWLGVPFAAPPVRELRWQPPQPLAPWQGTWQATRPAPQCLQPLRSPRQNHYFGVEATSEDCLYLNIWAPPGKREKLPVVVFIYGGGFNIGSASMANYSGEGLARDGVIRVNLAYRVGPLGFLSHPELSRESGTGASGNYGLMDLVAGLRWVKANIAAFGGDPANVTIAGQSAGAMAIAALQQSPMAAGLFHKIVAMSGSNFGPMAGPVPLARAEEQGLALQQELGAASLADLRALPGDRLVGTRTARDPLVVDGQVLRAGAEQAFASRLASDVPVLLGYTQDESFRPLGPVASQQDLERELAARFGTRAASIAAAYRSAGPARAAIDIARDASVGLQMADWARAQAAHGKAPVYAYLFARRQPYTAGVTFSDHDPATAGAYHTGDVPYWLRTRGALNLFRQTRTWEEGDAVLEEEMAQALVSFARTGTPRSTKLGAWPAFDLRNPAMVRLAPDPARIGWPHFADMTLLADAAPVPRPAGGAPRD